MAYKGDVVINLYIVLLQLYVHVYARDCSCTCTVHVIHQHLVEAILHAHMGVCLFELHLRDLQLSNVQ